MSYLLRMEEPARSFLCDREQVSAALFAKLSEWLKERFEINGDRYINNPEFQVAPGSPVVMVYYIFQDPGRNGAMRRFRFFVNTKDAVSGVFHLSYVDEP